MSTQSKNIQDANPEVTLSVFFWDVVGSVETNVNINCTPEEDR